ncbi:MAG: HAD family hydrolase [Gammaproteobacteria bacterium]|nr:HAD family hydrolase [Gammaproteobacteria bacterium]MCF6363669.1 HAD family hydrolase [Gammaproteobacteria bacterium]
MYSNKSALLLDMNSTFMFGEDNFGGSENFSKYYHKIGGTLPEEEVNGIIKSVYAYLDERYPDENYRHSFPTVEETINNLVEKKLSGEEVSKIVRTFAHHEIGNIPTEYIDVLHKLSVSYTLAVVIDIWSPKATWLTLFEELGIDKLFYASSFSSDHGIVKPSPKPFELVIRKLGIKKEKCLVIGDSIRRDLGGASAADIDCVLVGGAKHTNALRCYKHLLELSHDL